MTCLMNRRRSPLRVTSSIASCTRPILSPVSMSINLKRMERPSPASILTRIDFLQKFLGVGDLVLRGHRFARSESRLTVALKLPRCLGRGFILRQNQSFDPSRTVAVVFHGTHVTCGKLAVLVSTTTGDLTRLRVILVRYLTQSH